MIESVKIRDFLSHKDTMITLGNNTSVFVGNNGVGVCIYPNLFASI